MINIITKKASETKGAMIVASGGNPDPGFGTVQYGSSAGKSTDYRIHSKYFGENQLPGLTAADGGDGWNVHRAGFRTDSAVSARDELTFQGDLYTGREDQAAKILLSLASNVQLVDLSMNLSGGFFQANWNHQFSARSDISLEVSYDGYQRGNIVQERDKVLNVDFQHHYRWGQRQNLISGLSLYDSALSTDGGLAVSFNPADVTVRLFGIFAQDEIALVPDRLFLTIGARLQHFYYNGFGLMPTVRSAWKLTGHHTLWAAVSQAMNTPDQNETAMRLNFSGILEPNGTLLVPSQIGNPQEGNESAADYEMGYRSTRSPGLSLDLAAYYNQYSHFETIQPEAPFFEIQPAPAHIVLPRTYSNLMRGEEHGIEGFVNWKVFRSLTLSPGYAFERIHMHLDPDSRDTTSVEQAEGSSPVNSAQLRSHLSLSRGLAWDSSAYFVGRIADPIVPSYTRLDSGLTWQAGERLSFSVFGQNLLNNEQLEYVDILHSTASAFVKRSAYAKVRWIL